jgi:hypothetical protein
VGAIGQGQRRVIRRAIAAAVIDSPRALARIAAAVEVDGVATAAAAAAAAAARVVIIVATATASIVVIVAATTAGVVIIGATATTISHEFDTHLLDFVDHKLRPRVTARVAVVERRGARNHILTPCSYFRVNKR